LRRLGRQRQRSKLNDRSESGDRSQFGFSVHGTRYLYKTVGNVTDLSP
jgi:hypothetical protein